MLKDCARLGIHMISAEVAGIGGTACYLVVFGDSLACLASDAARPAKVSEEI